MDARQEKARESKPSASSPNKAQGKLVWEHRLLWVLLLAFLSLWGYHYAMGHVDRQLRATILRKLTERFPDHFVQLDHAHLQEGHAILLEGLQIALPTDDGPRDVLRIQRIVAHGPVHLLELMRDHVPIERVQVEGFELSAWPTEDQRWSLQTLSSEGPLPNSLPTIDIRSGLIRLGKSDASEGELIFHDLKARSRTIADRGVEFDTSVHGGFFQQLRAKLFVSLDKKLFNVQGELLDCECSERLLAKLPQPLQKFVQEANGLSCRTSAQFQASRSSDGKIDFDLRGDFRNGRLVHQRVPYLLENLQGEVYCKNNLVQLRNVSATNGAAKFQVEADIANPFVKPSCLINVQVQSLNLDQRLYQAIPKPLQLHWKKLAVSGIVDASVHLSYDGQSWSPDATIQCRSVDATPDIFPYPVQNIQGSFRFHNNVLLGQDITGTADGRKVTGSIRLEKASPKWLMDLQMSTDEWVGIDQKLLAALTPLGESPSKLEQFVRSLAPSGLVQIRNARFLRSAENPTKLMKWLEIGFHSGSIRYAGFTYPIFDIRGNVIVDNDVVLLKDLEGRNDSARIRCQGRCVCGPGNVEELRLSFDSQSVPLEEELQRALPGPVRELWNQLQPSGVVDNVQVTLERSRATQPLDIQVEISEAGLIDSQIGRSVSLRPIAIPYLLNDISCHIVYRPGVVDVLQMSGYHDSSHVKAEGTCRMQESGQWSGVLNWLPQSRVIVDQSLLAALPEKLRQPLVTLDFRGPVNVGGWTYFMTDAKGGQPYAQSWDLDLDIEEGRLRGGSIASGIRGTVQLKGEMTPRGPMVVGHFGIDSMAIRSIPVMDLRGKFAIDGEKLLFGREAVGVILPNSPKMNFAQASTSNGVQLASSQSPLQIVPCPACAQQSVQSRFKAKPSLVERLSTS